MDQLQHARKAHAEVIRAFFAPESRMPGGAKYRAALFAEGAQKQQCYPICEVFPEEPPYEDARTLLLSQPDVNTGLNLDAVLYVTDDPSVIWAETIEYGEIELCGKRGMFKGHSNHIFHLKDEKITVWRFFPNVYPIRDTLGMPFQKLPRFSYDENCMQDYLTRRDPMRLVDTVEPDLTGGMKTRIRVLDEYRCTVEDEITRRTNAHTLFKYFGENVTKPGGYIYRTALYHEDGCTSVTFPHQDPTAELPNLFLEHQVEHGEPDPDMTFYIDRMYPTGDPDIIWVETKSNGWHPHAPDGTPLDGYWNHYTQYYQFKDGKIYHMREIYDPTKERKIKGTGDAPLPREAVDFYRFL